MSDWAACSDALDALWDCKEMLKKYRAGQTPDADAVDALVKSAEDAFDCAQNFCDVV